MTDAPKHAKFSPSGSTIWLACPASIRLSEGLPDTSSEASERGTRIHQTGEELLLGLPLTYPEHADDAMPYIQFVGTVTAGYELHVERRVHLVDECNGTADVIAIRGDHGVLIDLKTGRVPVAAKDNPQLEIYAAAAAKEFGLASVEAIIWQTGMTPVSTFLYRDDFRRIEAAVSKAIEEHETKAPEAGAHCRWCKARAHCAERARHVLSGLGASLIPDGELGLMLAQARVAAEWAADIEARALSVLSNGGTLLGFKLVEGTSRRKWTADALAVIESAGLTELITVRQPLPITEVERQLGKRETAELLSTAIEKPAGKPAVVPSTDPRPTIGFGGGEF